MAHSVDLTLPSKAPEIARYHDRSMALLPFALYDLVGLFDKDYAHLLSVCNSEYGDHDNAVKRPPRTNFRGKALREVFEYHISLISGRTFEPFNFLAVTSHDWQTVGVLVVALDDDNMQCDVDKCFLKAEKTGLALVNLQIDNLDWSDVKADAIN